MKLLIVGDAVSQTGFARVVHNLADQLKDRWEIHILGVNYHGDPHSYPYPIYPAVLGGDSHGIGRLPGMLDMLRPDAVLLVNDPWIIADYLEVIHPNVPVLAYMPVDAPNQNSAKRLNRLNHAIAYTNFGKKELALGGYAGPCSVIPHGVDTMIYQPKDRMIGRKRLGFPKGIDPEKAFIIGNVNRNSKRKRLDLTIQYFTEWWVSAGMPDHAFLYLHCSNVDEGWDLIDLARYYGVWKQLIMTNPKMRPGAGINETDMPDLYSLMDCLMSTAMGEGWGLTTMEAMACGVASIVGRYSALGEWPRGAVHYVDITSFEVTDKRINTIGGVPDRAQFVAAIDRMYRDVEYRQGLAKAGVALVRDAKYSWKTIGDQFHLAILESVVANSNRSKQMGTEVPQA